MCGHWWQPSYMGPVPIAQWRDLWSLSFVSLRKPSPCDLPLWLPTQSDGCAFKTKGLKLPVAHYYWASIKTCTQLSLQSFLCVTIQSFSCWVYPHSLETQLPASNYLWYTSRHFLRAMRSLKGKLSAGASEPGFVIPVTLGLCLPPISLFIGVNNVAEGSAHLERYTMYLHKIKSFLSFSSK